MQNRDDTEVGDYCKRCKRPNARPKQMGMADYADAVRAEMTRYVPYIKDTLQKSRTTVLVNPARNDARFEGREGGKYWYREGTPCVFCFLFLMQRTGHQLSKKKEN